MNVFIDTNVFLSLYAFSQDDLSVLRKIFRLTKEGAVNFLLPQQVVDEFERNRSSKIAESVKKLRESGAKGGVPIIARDLEAFQSFQEASAKAIAAQKELLDELHAKAADRTLAADNLIDEIFSSTKVITITDKIYHSAVRRVDLGNPPGKRGSLGDAVNWEAILTKIDLIEELHFISQDADYRSPLNDNRFNEFLVREYDGRVWDRIHFYQSLREFLKKCYPDAVIEQYEVVGDTIERYESSRSFAQTHAAVAELSAIGEFTPGQISRIVEASTSNSQISWISGDSDLQDFYQSIRKKYHKQLSAEVLEELDGLISTTEQQA
jgi:predicted nucleic acid-binding protein